MTIADVGDKGLMEQKPNEILERLRFGEGLLPIGLKSLDKSILEKQVEGQKERDGISNEYNYHSER